MSSPTLKTIESKIDGITVKQDELINDFSEHRWEFKLHEKEEFSIFGDIRKRLNQIEDNFHTIEDKVKNHDIRINWVNVAVWVLFVLVVLLFIIVMIK